MSDDEGTGTGSSSDRSGHSDDDSVGGAARREGDSADQGGEEPADETREGSADEIGDEPADVEPMDVETADPEEVERLRRRVEAFEADIEDRTVHREDLESDLERYVRRKLRRGHARGWGPYLVLLYGTVMTLGAFYFLSGVWAVLAMFVIWLSTLGLYVVMLMVGLVGAAIGLPRRALDRVQDMRD